jgi:hypothetical protein
VLRAVRDSDLTPVILDLWPEHAPNLSVVLGLAGTRAEVDWQLDLAKRIGFAREGNLDYEQEFWKDSTPVNRISVLPSCVVEAATALGSVPFVARAGNGAIYFRGAKPAENVSLPVTLMRRVKGTFDPNNILPELIP